MINLFGWKLLVQSWKTSCGGRNLSPVHQLAQNIVKTKSTISRHLREIVNKKKMDKWALHELMRVQKQRRHDLGSNLLLRHENDPFLKHIIAYDVKWILYNNTKRYIWQWLDKNETPKHFPKPDFHQKKCMVTVWWSVMGIVHYSFLKTGLKIMTTVRRNAQNVVQKTAC